MKKKKDKKKNITIIVAIIAILVLIVISLLIIFNKKVPTANVPDDYISKFYGGSGEIVYETYIYKIDNNQANYGFKYINVTCITKSWGSSEYNCKIDSKGVFDWTDGAFTTAQKHGAYDGVETKDGSRYSIEEYQGMFLMN